MRFASPCYSYCEPHVFESVIVFIRVVFKGSCEQPKSGGMCGDSISLFNTYICNAFLEHLMSTEKLISFIQEPCAQSMYSVVARSISCDISQILLSTRLVKRLFYPISISSNTFASMMII